MKMKHILMGAFAGLLLASGAALAQHFPPQGPAKNKLPNTLLET